MRSRGSFEQSLKQVRRFSAALALRLSAVLSLCRREQPQSRCDLHKMVRIGRQHIDVLLDCSESCFQLLHVRSHLFCTSLPVSCSLTRFLLAIVVFPFFEQRSPFGHPKVSHLALRIFKDVAEFQHSRCNCTEENDWCLMRTPWQLKGNTVVPTPIPRHHT